MSSLMHHGIKGQRWGVRRFQNKDGTRTAAGKKQLKAQRLSRNEKGIRDVYRSLSDEDFRTLGYSKEEADQERKDDFLELGRRHTDYDQYNRVRYKDGKAVGYIAATGYQTTVGRGKKVVNILAVDLAVHSEYRGNGYSVALGKDLVRWFDTYGSKEYDRIEWYAMSENIGSQKAAERSGFTRRSSKEAAKGWVKYRYDKKQKLQHTSIGGTMYIEGNTLILGDSSYLEHHGILGQKWGVRRFQNKDGTRTAAGKARDAENLRFSQEAKNVNSKLRSYINKQLSSEDLDDLDTGKSNFDFASHLIKDPDFEKVIMPVVQDIRQTKAKYGNKEPYELTGDEHKAYMNDISRIDNKTGELAIAIGLAEKGEPHKKSTPPEGEYERVDMFRYALARYLDEHSPDGYSDEGDWIYHSSMEGGLFIEDGTLYLSHHGIRGQRWGVRRFQNRDGSLTNAGRKRLGYAVNGASATVKKAFKAGVKTGAKAVKAAKAHHKKVEEKKIEKKKEKASKTRAGVYANKDLFTSKELKELNAKFEEQDKLAMARLKKGVEIAKAVGQYAQTAKQIGDAYQSITGKNILSHITEIKSANEAKAKEEKETADKAKAEAEAAAKKAESKAMAKEALQKNIDAFKADQESEARVKDLEKQGNKTAAKTKLAEYIDRYNQDKAAQEQTKQMMKNQKLQEYIDRANQAQREKDAATLKETTERGQKAIEILSKGGKFNSDLSESAPAPKPAPSSNNLMAQIKAAQTKLKKPNKNETPAEHKEAQKKLNALEKVANEYKAAANKPGADPAEITEKLLKKNKNILDDIKHMDFSDTDYLEHYGVRGMKWGRHLMAGKGGGIYDGTALGGGGGGGPMTEEERKKLEALKKKKEEEARKEQETAEKAKEIGVSVEAYKRYSIDNNHLPGKSHYTKSNKLHNEASASVAAAQAAERQAHINKAKAASLSRKVNSSHMFDSEGYHISQQRADDRNEAKRLRKEAKKLSKDSRRALKKFYKKRYKADKERQKWQNSTSGKYHHMMRHYGIQNGVLFVDSSDYLSHHGVKGQRWGVRRFQNEDGTLTDKGRKHYEKAIAKLDRKQTNSDALRGRLERMHPFAVTASAVLNGAAYASLMVASAANPVAVAAGTAVVAAISGLYTHGVYSFTEAWEGRGTRHRQKKRKEYEELLNHADMEEGMYHVENGTLFINADEPYLEHHGVLGMKWGKHLRAGKGPVDGQAGAGGGGGEDDEKLKEMAKKAGMTVAEYRNKMASKISGAASKAGEAVYNAAGGKYKNYEAGMNEVARQQTAEAQKYKERANKLRAESAAENRKAKKLLVSGDGHGYLNAAENAKSLKSSAKEAERHSKANLEIREDAIKQASEYQAKYEKSLSGRYDKMKADRARKKSIKKRQSVERALSNGPVEAKPKKSLGKRLEEKLGVTNEKSNKPKQSKEAKRIEDMYKDATRKDKAFSGTSPKAKKKVATAGRKENSNLPQSVLNPKHTVANKTGYSYLRQQKNKKPTPGDTPIPSPTQYTHENRPRGREKFYKLTSGKSTKGVKKRKRTANHFDGSDAIYTEGTRLTINSKWG